MNQDFIIKQMHHFIYEHKADTATSYYSQTETLLPERLSISSYDMAKVQNKGRILANGKKGQLMGQFTRKESSPLKQHKPFVCRTEIFRCESNPLLFGYGTIGISNKEGKVTRASDKGDLVVLYTSDYGKTFHIFFFYGMGSIQFKDEALTFVQEWVKKNLL